MPPVTAPAAAPAAPSPAAPAAPAEPDTKLLFKNLADSVNDDPIKKPEPKPAPAAPAPADPPAPAAGAPKPGDDQTLIKVRKPAPPKRPDLPIPGRAAAPTPPAAPIAPAAPAAAAPAAAEDKVWEEGLLKNERRMLADARFAEKRFPERHSGLAQRVTKFLKDHATMVEKADFDESSPEYQQFLNSRPQLDDDDVRELSDARVSDKMKSEYDPKLSDLQHELFKRDEEPKIAAEGTRMFQVLSGEALPEDMMKAYKDAGGGAKGLEVLNKDYADEMRIAGGVMRTAVGDLQELLRLGKKSASGRPLETPAGDPSHPKFAQHERLSTLVAELCTDFLKNGGKELLKKGDDGKERWFVTRDEWNLLPRESKNDYWTFTNEELADRGLRYVPTAVRGAIKNEQEALKARGYSRLRAAPPPAAPPADPPRPGPAPAPRPTPLPAANAPAGDPTSLGAKIMSNLNREA